MKKKSGIFVLITYGLLTLSAQAQKSAVDSFMHNKMHKLHIPGFEAIAIKNGKVTWTGYYGYQNLEKKIPVSSQTLFEAASTSKTVTAAVMMQLYATGKFRLDDDINRYLDFRIVNPRYPAVPITFGQLLRHRSSIDDDVDYLSQFWETNHGDPVISLKDFIKGYFAVSGKHYDKDKNFHNYPPGTQAEYSNMGIALLGYLAERISGRPFNELCKSELFDPLEMKNSGWFLHEINADNLAMPYGYSDSLQKYQALGFGGFPDYPAGTLHTNVAEFAHFLIAWTQQGIWNNKHALDSAAIQKLTPNDFQLGFYTWFQYATNKGEILYIHTGKANGVSSFISYDPKSKRGLIFICNGDIINSKDWRSIIDTLYETVF